MGSDTCSETRAADGISDWRHSGPHPAPPTGAAPKPRLLPLILRHYHLDSIRDIVRVIYDARFARDQVSVLAPDVVRLARAGDRVAVDIVRTGGERLAGIALGVARQLHQPGDPVTVYPTGGVFTAGELVTSPFKRRLTSAWPAVAIAAPRFPAGCRGADRGLEGAW